MTSSSLNWWWLHAITVKYEEKKIKKLQVQTEIVAWVSQKKVDEVWQKSASCNAYRRTSIFII